MPGVDDALHLLKRLEIAEHCRDQLRHCRMNVDRPLDDRVGRVRVHDVEHGVNNFVAADAEDRCAEDLLTLSIDHDLHEPLGFTPLARPADAGHLHLAYQRPSPRFSHLAVRQSDATQRRVDVEPVGGDAVADPSGIVVKHIGRNDLVIVVGGVGKCAVAVDVA